MAELMRLRVPTGWWLVRNELVDASPLDPSVPRNTFSDTMLYAERGVPHGRDDRFIVDVSWKPANDSSGHYKLTAVAGSWERVLGVFVTEDREALRAVLEAWLAELAVAGSPEQAKRRIEAVTPR